ncbi:MAG: phosphoribosyl-ATP diphosphatase [Planctomycetes bacterium]|nr:phosphoribosyl-ATP diphosphatase [Planctomycetota bacterium]
MIVPSIDLLGGRAVQLVGGRELKIDAGDPRPIAERFALAGEIAVVDLDAALGRGDNRALIEELLRIAPCRVGGGIRDADSARRWLDAGATRVVLGTAARPDVLEQLPPERTIAALDAVHGEVVDHGWTRGTGRGVAERMAELRELCTGFLVTFVEREGRLGGTAPDAEVRALCEAAGGARVTIAGGVTDAAEVARLDALGADAQVGMALYEGRLDLGDAIAAPLHSDRPDGLWPTVVVDERGTALGLVYSSAASLRAAVAERRGIYQSRTRGLWRKGASSGDVQELLRVDLDCDRDALRFVVRQHGAGFCHLERPTCFGPAQGLDALERTLAVRLADAPAGSYTRRLLDDPDLLHRKLVEEAHELAEASDPAHVAREAADVLYFAAVRLAKAGVRFADVERELDRRALRVTRRPGAAKPPRPGDPS